MSVPQWAESLPDDLKALPVVQQTPDVPTLVKRLVDLDSYKGRSIALPKDGDEEGAKAFEQAVAKRGFIRGEVPADPSGYDPVDTTGLDLGEDWQKTRLADFHAMGLTKAQAKAALEREVGGMKAAFEGIQKDHGPAGLEAIKKAAARYNIDGNPAAVLNLLRELGSQMTEDQTKVGQGAPTGKSLTEIEAEIVTLNEQIMKLPEYDPRSQLLLDQKVALLKQRAAATR